MVRIACLVTMLAFLSSPIAAAPPRAGGEFAVNTWTTANQLAPDVAMDGFVVG